jgi:hypothetical protein
MAIRSTGPYPASPTTAKEQWGKVNSFGQLTTRLTGPISLVCDRYVQYLLAGANRMVLNRHRQGPTEWSLIGTGRGYNLGGAGLPHTHSPTFPTSCPHFPLMAPPCLHFNHIFAKDQRVEVLRTYGRHVIFRPLDHLP